MSTRKLKWVFRTFFISLFTIPPVAFCYWFWTLQVHNTKVWAPWGRMHNALEGILTVTFYIIVVCIAFLIVLWWCNEGAAAMWRVAWRGEGWWTPSSREAAQKAAKEASRGASRYK